MEEFLAALPTGLQQAVREALGIVGHEALELAAHDFIGVDGDWPTERFTAQLVAHSFLTENRSRLPDALLRSFSHQMATSSGAGPLVPIITGLMAGGVGVAASRGMIILGNTAVQRYWEQGNIDHANAEKLIKSAAAKVLRNVTARSDWDLIGQVFSRVGFDPETWENQVAARYRSGLFSHLVGILGRAAYSGQRHALDNFPEMSLREWQAEVGPWAREYAARLVFNQSLLSERAARVSLHTFLETGLPPEGIGSRLRMMFGLSPAHALAVENYRRGLHEQDKPKGLINRLTQRYANRLISTRMDLLAKTEAMVSINVGRQLLWEKAVREGKLPADTRKMWVTAGDERVCPVCRPMDGNKVPLMGGFETDAGPVLFPPVHPQCRCMILPGSGEGTSDWSRIVIRRPTSSRELVGKHLPGEHDQKEHGNWIRRLTGGVSRREFRRVAEAIEGDSYQETFDNIVEWLQAKRLVKSKIEYGFIIDAAGKVVDYTLGQEHHVRVPKAVEGNTLIHRHPEIRPGHKKFGAYLESGRALSPTDMALALQRGAYRVVAVNERGYAMVTIPKNTPEEARQRAAWSAFQRAETGTFNQIVTRGLEKFGDDKGRIDDVVKFVEDEMNAEWRNWTKNIAVKHLGVKGMEYKVKHRPLKMTPEQKVADLLERIAYIEGYLKETVVDKHLLYPGVSSARLVDKHLQGQHDQKKHGKKTFSVAGQEVGRTGAYATLGTVALAGLAAGGLFVLRRPPPGMQITPVQVPLGLQMAPVGMRTPVQVPPPPPTAPTQVSGPRLAEPLASYAQKMNQGVDPQQSWITDTVSMLKGSTVGFRRAYEGGGLEGSFRKFADMVTYAPHANRTLYRGMGVQPDIVNSYQVGRRFTIGPSSFTSDFGSARMFAGPGLSSTPVIVRVQNPRALDIDSWRSRLSVMTSEKEWLASGRYRITNVERDGLTVFIDAVQDGLLEFGQRAAWVAKVLERLGVHD